MTLTGWCASIRAQSGPSYTEKWNKYRSLSIKYFRENDRRTATIYTDSLYRIGLQLNNDSLKTEALCTKAAYMEDTPETDSIISLAVKSAEDLGIQRLYFRALNDQQLYFFAQGRIKESYLIARQLELLPDTTRNKNAGYYARMNLAQIFGAAGKHQEAIAYYKQLIEILPHRMEFKKAEYKPLAFVRLTEYYVHAAISFMELGKKDSAKIFIQKAYEEGAFPSGNAHNFTLVWLSRFDLYNKPPFDVQQMRSSLDSVEKHLQWEDKMLVLQYRQKKALLDAHLGRWLACQNEAKALLKDAEADGNLLIQLDAFKLLYQSAKKMGAAWEALNYQEKWTHLRDSIINYQLKLQIAVDEADRILQEKAMNHLKTVQRAALLQQRNQWLQFSLLFALLMIAVILIFAVYSYRQMVQKKELNQTLLRINNKLNRFSSTVSHDMITHIDLFLSKTMLLHPPPNSEYFRFVTDSRNTFKKMKQYCLQLLEEAKSKTNRPVVFDPMPEVNSILTDFNRVLSEKKFNITISPLPPSILPPPIIHHLFQNLVSNAVKYVNAFRPSLIIKGETLGEVTIWTIEDNGPGIPVSQLSDIMTQPIESKTGEGVGLYQLQQSLTEYQTTLTVENRPNGGAVFTVCIPHQ